MDLAAPPFAFLSTDAVPQTDVNTYLRLYDRSQGDRDFHACRRKEILLSQLGRLYKRGSVSDKIRLLQSRYKVVVDDKYTRPADHASVNLDMSCGTMDFKFCVPRQPGFGAVVPNTIAGLHWCWKLFITRARYFGNKHAMLGFDPVGSMLYIGTANDEDLWLVFAPNRFFRDDPDCKYDRPGTLSGDPRLSTLHWYYACIWIAFSMMTHGISDVTCSEEIYWDLHEPTLDGLKEITNLL